MLPAFGLNTGKYGPEKTPYLDTFLRSVGISIEKLSFLIQYLKNLVLLLEK